MQPFSHSTITTIDACNVPVISARNCSHTHTHTHTHTNTTATVSRENCGCNSRAARDLSDRQHHGDSYRPNRSLFKDTRTNDHSYRLATTNLYTATECSVLSIVGWTSDSAHRNIVRNSAKYLLRPKCLYVSAAVRSRSAFSLRCFCDLHSLPVWTTHCDSFLV